MRAAVLHVNTASRDSVSPTMRIAKFVADELKIDLIHDVATAKRAVMPAMGKLDVLFVKLGVLKFSQHREEAVRLVQNARMVINLENDFTFKPDKRLARDDMYHWSTVEKRDRYINWNKLTWNDSWEPEALRAPLVRGVLYYGAYKDIRKASFERYFRPTRRYPLTISTFRGKPHFEAITQGNAKIIGAFRDKTAPQDYMMTIYMEDDYSHSLYCSPANRFYECLQLGVAQVFDGKTLGTMEQAGYEVPGPMIVAGTSDVEQALKRWDAIRRWQRKHWFRDYRTELRHELRAVCRAHFGAKYKFT